MTLHPPGLPSKQPRKPMEEGRHENRDAAIQKKDSNLCRNRQKGRRYQVPLMSPRLKLLLMNFGRISLPHVLLRHLSFFRIPSHRLVVIGKFSTASVSR
jgi:hypothetical protein